MHTLSAYIDFIIMLFCIGAAIKTDIPALRVINLLCAAIDFGLLLDNMGVSF